MQVDPGVAALGQQHALGQGVGVDQAQLQFLLTARHPLVAEPLAVRQPLHAGEVDVRILAQVDPARGPAGRRDQAQLDRDVGIAGERIALRHHRGAVGVQLHAPGDRHRRRVVALVGDCRIVRCPPVAGAAAHFLLGHELGLAVVHGAAAVGGQLRGLPAGQVDHPQVLVLHVGHVVAGGRDLRVDGLAAGIQRGHALVLRLVQVVQVQRAIHGDQQLVPVRRPLVVQDAVQARGALALAARPLGVRQLLAGGRQRGRIDQHLHALVGQVVLPQVEGVLVVGLGAQEGHARAIRRDLQPAHVGAAQAAAVEDAFDGEFLGHGRTGGHRQDAGKHECAHRDSCRSRVRGRLNRVRASASIREVRRARRGNCFSVPPIPRWFAPYLPMQNDPKMAPRRSSA